MHWLCKAAEGHPGETSRGSRKYEIKRFKIKDTPEGRKLQSEGGPYWKRASTDRTTLFWNREGFDASVHGRRARLTAPWHDAGCPGRNPGTGKPVKLPDDRASGFNIKTHCGKETVAAVGGGKEKRKRAKSSTKKQKAAKRIKDTMNAIFGDEEGVEDIFGCVVSLDNMSSMSHPAGMNERLTEIFCEPSKPLKLLKDGEEKRMLLETTCSTPMRGLMISL